MKKCKVCGKEFDAKGRDKCCSKECSKVSKRNYQKNWRQSDAGKASLTKYNQSEKGKATQKKAKKKYNRSAKGKAKAKEYRKSDRGKEVRKKYQESDKYKAVQKRYNQSEKGKTTRRKAEKKYRESDKGRKARKEYQQKRIAELNEKYDGDLVLILKDCPTSWQVREAIMQVEYGVSYAEAMYQKMKLNPVCEVTGESGDLVNHHLDSFNTHPEKGADLDNIVRVKSEIHDEFHNIYGRGNNTREQWFEFLEKKHNIYI